MCYMKWIIQLLKRQGDEVSITREQCEEAQKRRDEADKVIRDYFREKQEAFDKRMQDNPVFTDDELIYSASSYCLCGHGLAYPKDCGPTHYWDCSAILKGVADPKEKHSDRYPFVMWSIKGEGQPSAHGKTTRGNPLKFKSA